MAKKKKNRRSVLITSCVMAALIVGSSTFAWFSSTDDVTNRLTSTANYGVSIVESFTPPANWIPGQKVDKQVFAVNTGNIDAFVREDITGMLSFTYEKLAATFETNKDRAVVLDDTTIGTIDGVTTMEGGAFLAWSSVGETVGEKTIDHEHAGTSWKPSQTGDYVFRRSIGDNKFTYAGYHYDSGENKYYKIVIGEDTYPTTTAEASLVADDNATFDVSVSSENLGVAVDNDGVLLGAPVIRYVVAATVDSQPVSFLYEGASTETGKEHGPRLVVNFKADMALSTVTSDSSGNQYDANASAARAEIDYLNAKKVSDEAEKAYNDALADYTYARTLAEATQTLISVADTTNAQNDTTSLAVTENNQARAAVATKAGAIKVSTEYGAIDLDTIAPNDTTGILTAKEVENASDSSYPQLSANKTAMDNKYATMTSLKYDIERLLTELSEPINDPSDVAKKVTELKSKADSLKTALDEYKVLYANFEAVSSVATGLEPGVSDNNKQKIATMSSNVQSVIGAVWTDDDSLKALSADYTSKNSTMESETGKNTQQTQRWNAAVEAYNNTVSEAKSTYNRYVTTNIAPNNTNTIEAAYAATKFVTNATAVPTLETDDEKNFSNFEGKSITLPEQASYPDNTNSVTALEGEKTRTAGVTSEKDKIYKDAIAALNATSTITIYVNLDEDYANSWHFDQATVGTKKASFYLKSILEKGKTSNMLVKSIELSNEVKAGQYKDMTFDLNVGLKSIQVTYEDDQKTISTAAVNGSDDFALKATVSNNTTVEWN